MSVLGGIGIVLIIFSLIGWWRIAWSYDGIADVFIAGLVSAVGVSLVLVDLLM